VNSLPCSGKFKDEFPALFNDMAHGCDQYGAEGKKHGAIEPKFFMGGEIFQIVDEGN
jgi:hypothetical protein